MPGLSLSDGWYGFCRYLPRFVQRALRVVVGLQRLAIFVGGALALSGQVEDLAQLNVAPDFGPARLAVAVERLAIGVRRRLVVVLQKEHLGNAVVRQRAVLVDVERLLEFLQRFGQVALLDVLLARA